jgi:zinc and cadmium transporter
MVGDSLHNFIDGVAIAATFMTSIPLGIVTSLAVATHEIPQEIGDFGVMLHKGMPRKKIIFFNVASAAVAMVGALLTYFSGSIIQANLPYLLALTAGFFIYIAASHIIPEIHHKNRKNLAALESLLLIFGVIVVWISVTLLEGSH